MCWANSQVVISFAHTITDLVSVNSAALDGAIAAIRLACKSPLIDHSIQLRLEFKAPGINQFNQNIFFSTQLHWYSPQ